MERVPAMTFTAPPRAGRRVRPPVGPRRVLDQPGDADRQPGAAGDRGCDPGAVHAVAHLHDVPGPRPAGTGDRGVDLRVLGWERDRTRVRRRAAGAVLVGLGVPARTAGDGPAARAGTDRAARVPGPRRPAAGPAQRGDVAGGGPGRGLGA